GVMEFAPAEQPLPPGGWTRELNFLAWRPAGGQADVVDLPTKARVRVSVQWKEAHDPVFLDRGEDVYREPLANLQLLAVRQADPAGKQRPSDDVEVVAQSSGLPQRLENQPSYAVYEQTVELEAAQPGRYAVRV